MAVYRPKHIEREVKRRSAAGEPDGLGKATHFTTGQRCAAAKMADERGRITAALVKWRQAVCAGSEAITLSVGPDEKRRWRWRLVDAQAGFKSASEAMMPRSKNETAWPVAEAGRAALVILAASEAAPRALARHFLGHRFSRRDEAPRDCRPFDVLLDAKQTSSAEE